MYITVNNNTYPNAERVKGAQWVELRADGLAGVTPSGAVTRYRDDGFEIGTDNVADYLRVESIDGGFRLTNVPVPQPVEPKAKPVDYAPQESTMYAVSLLLAANAIPVATDDERIVLSGLYADWAAGKHEKGEIYRADNQVWECYQSYDNAVYPDIVPGNSAWYTFNRPLHGTSKETAREFVQPTGAHDMYKVGEWMIQDGKYFRCKQDTAYSPKDYAAAWEDLGTDGAETETPSEEETPAEEVIPDFVQPTGAHDAYNAGDKVKFNGKVYKSKMDNNVYSPSAYPAGWEEVG